MKKTINMINEEYFIESAKNGQPTLYYYENKEKRYIHSRYNPEFEAETLIKNCDFKKFDFIVLFGSGLGYIPNLIKNNENIKKIIVIEKDELIYNKFLEINKKKKYSGIDFLIDKDKEFVKDHIVDHFDLLNYKGFYLIEYAPVLNLDPLYFFELKNLLNLTLHKKIDNQLTESHLGITLINNFLNNLSLVHDINLITLNKEFSRDKGVIIVSAGPSLENDIKSLKKIQNQYYIFAVDITLKYLLKNDIIPDAVFSMDPQFFTYLHFYPEALKKKIHYIFDLFSGFPAIQINKFSSFIISNNFLSHILFNKKDIIEYAGGSITNFIFQYVRNYFKTIIFMGLDLCYDNYIMYIPHTYLNSYFLKRNHRFSSLQTRYFNFYSSRAKRKIKFKDKEYLTTQSMANYYDWLKNNASQENVFFSKNSFIDFENIKKIGLKDVEFFTKKNKEKQNSLFEKKIIIKKNILIKLKNILKNEDFIRILSERVIFSRYINNWKELNDNSKEMLYRLVKEYLSIKLEKLLL